MAPYTSWKTLSSAINSNTNRHCSLQTLQKQTMHIIESEPAWLAGTGWKLLHESIPAHPLSIPCIDADPFFRYSDKINHSNGIRTQISELSQKFDDVYKENNGRTRGWIKSHFLAWFLKVEALEKWTWDYDSCLKDKLSSAVCDFVAVWCNVTIAVLFPDKMRVVCYPTGRPITNRVICIDGISSNWLLSPSGPYASRDEFKSLAFKLGWKWLAPASVSIPETITELRAKILAGGDGSLPTMTKQELVGWIWRAAFV
jgi:hypothetical protein